MIWKSKKLAIVALLVSTLLIARALGKKYEQNVSPLQTTQATSTQEVISASLPKLPEELYRACTCESNGGKDGPKQFETDGSIVFHNNDDGSTDWGACQINSVHEKEAAAMGIDFKQSIAGNYQMALAIYEEQGIGAWNGYDPETKTCSYY